MGPKTKCHALYGGLCSQENEQRSFGSVKLTKKEVDQGYPSTKDAKRESVTESGERKWRVLGDAFIEISNGGVH